MPAPHPASVKLRVFELHADGLSDARIAASVGISLGGVSGWLNGKRVRNGKPHRIKLDNGNHVCSDCGGEKHPNLFPPERFNGTGMSEVSFCRECSRSRQTRQRRGTLSKYLATRFWDLKGKSSAKNIPFSIDEDFLGKRHEAQYGRCFYTDDEMIIPQRREGSEMRQAISVDRVVPEVGYTPGNIVLCTYKANAVKQNISVEEMYQWLPGWYWRLVDAGIIERGEGTCRSVSY